MAGLCRRFKDERGQTAVFFVVFSVVVAMSAGVVIESGRLYLSKRNMQGVADAAALAAVRAIPTSQSDAEDIALDYAENRNSQDEGTLLSVDTDTDSITVEVENTVDGDFLGFFSASDSNDVAATATAEVRSTTGVGKSLPMALMRGSFTYGDVTEIKTQNASGPGNHGAVRLEEEPPCGLSSGANDFRNFIRTTANGGIDSCPTPIGDEIATETGNMSGPTRQGLDDRIGGNDDSFEDIFQWDAEIGGYKVIKPDSPRLGVVPIIENTDGSTDWPNGQSPLRIVGYTMVYIGDSDNGNAAYTNNGRSVWVRPVQGILPSTFSSGLGAYDPDLEAPIVFRLSE